jgi:hypothetical protein
MSFDNFWDTFSTLYDLHFPLREIKPNKNFHKQNDFMTNGLLVSRRRKIELYKLSLTNPADYLTKYKQYRNLFNKILRASKSLYYDAKFTQYAKNPKKTWETLNELTSSSKNKSTKIPSLITPNETITEPTAIAEEFNSFFSQAGQQISDSVPLTNVTPESYLPPIDAPAFELGNTGPIHVSDLIKSFPSKTSLDIDGISLKLLKYIKIEISTPLAYIFDLSLTEGIFPNKLKINRTVPIFKAGDSKKCDNYRPISLIPTLSKILEKMVATKLTNFLQINKLLYKHQYGFQRGLSTEQNLISVTNFIGTALNKGNFCIGVFLDLRKAFDTCSHRILLTKLSKLGVNGTALQWFRSYLTDRHQKVEVNNHLSSSLPINCGVFQGSILGPLLFLCYINDIHRATELATFLFADDTSCLAEHNNLQTLITYVNAELQKLATWFKANKMAVNVSKTNYIIFRTRGKKIDADLPDVVFNSNDLDSVSPDPSLIQKLERIHDNNDVPKLRSFKLLGILLDEYLTFNNHIAHICSKLSRANFCLRRISNFVSTKTLRTLYFSMFHSHLLYCSTITSCGSQTALNKISTLQKKAIRIITKSKASTHTPPLFLNSHILPFEKLLTQGKLLFMHSIAFNYAPTSFANIWLKNETRDNEYQLRNNDLFILPPFRIELFKKLPIYSLPLAWNELPDSLRYQHNRTTFKIALSDHLFDSLT